jgi:hypothetical protein
VQEVQTNAPPGVPPLPIPPGIDPHAPLGDAMTESAERLRKSYRDSPQLVAHYEDLLQQGLEARSQAREAKDAQARAEATATARTITAFLKEEADRNSRLAFEAFKTALKEVPPAARTAAPTKAARPRTARRQHTSTTRTTVAAASAASGESGSQPSRGAQGSRPPAPSADDDPQPPNRLRVGPGTWRPFALLANTRGPQSAYKGATA